MSGSKAELRKIYLEHLARTEQSWLDLSHAGLLINVRNLLEIFKPGPGTALLAWLPFFYGEPSLLSLQKELAFNFFFPRLEGSEKMEFYSSSEFVDDGIRGLKQPLARAADKLNPERYESTVCFVPGLAFDSKGSRLGRGKGMYDRFLAMAGKQTNLKKIGVCWSFQIAETVPTEEHDQKMDLIVTELGVIRLEDQR